MTDGLAPPAAGDERRQGRGGGKGELRLSTLAGRFLLLGAVGFGGALASMSLMEREWVRRRGLVAPDEFLEGLALCYLLPGPTSVLLAIYLGARLRGLLGGLASGLAFLTPAVLLTLLLSGGYFRFRTLPTVGALFLALGPVVVALILAMLYRSGKGVFTSRSRWGLGTAVALLLLFPVLPQAWNLVTLLLLAGLLGMLLFREPATGGPATSVLALAALPVVKAMIGPGLAVLLPLALTVLKVSLLMFGGGVVAIPLLQQELVATHHWLTPQQFVDGVAIGQLTPGPITVVATFAGYAVAGIAGAVVATVAMYAPAFVLMLGGAPLLARLRRAPLAQAMLRGVTVGALGMIGATAVLLGRTAIDSLGAAAILLASLLLLLRWNVHPAFVVLGAALLALVRRVVSPG